MLSNPLERKRDRQVEMGVMIGFPSIKQVIISGLNDAASRRWLTRRMLAVAAAVVGILTMVNVLLAMQ